MQWDRCRDAASGGDAVKAKREVYLPRLSGQKPGGEGDKAYANYLLRALYFNGVDRTATGLAGAVFRKPASVANVPDVVEDHLKDVTQTGVSIQAMAYRVLGEVINPGRFGVLLDVQKSEEVSPRPTWLPYCAEDIVNWRTRVVDGDTVLTLLVLRECYQEQKKANDEFELENKTRYRVCRLLLTGDGDELTRSYEVSLWEKVKDAQGQETWRQSDLQTPHRRGAPLTEIPFTFFGPDGVGPDVCKPPLLDLVDVNLSLFRNSADFEHGLHYLGIPQPWVTGLGPSGTLSIGPSRVWTLNDANAKVGMLEFTGSGLGTLREAMADKRQLMATLGGRLLESQKTGQETAEAVKMRHSGEHAVLSSMAQAVAQGMTWLLRKHLWWAGFEDATTKDAAVALNTDFLQATITPDVLRVLLLALQAGELTFEDWYYVLERAEVVRPGMSIEEVKKLIEAQRDARMQESIDLFNAQNPEPPPDENADDNQDAPPKKEPKAA